MSGTDLRRCRRLGVVLLAGAGLAACGPKPSSAPTASAAPATSATPASSGAQANADDQAAAELKEHHRHHHHGGITAFIAMSLDTLGADEAKAPQIEKVQHDLHVCLAPARDAEKELIQSVADGVAAGAIDTAKVDAGVAKVEETSAAVHPCSTDALNKLHAILSQAERQALVDKVEAHWKVWKQVNHEAEPGGKEKGGRLAELSRELELSPEQVEKISAALKTGMGPGAARAGKFDPARAEAHMQAFATAFVGDAFEAHSVTANANGHLAAHGAKRMSLFYEIVTPQLTADQRAKLAAHLREHAGQHPTASSQ